MTDKQKKYLDRFYEVAFTASDCLEVFIAIYASLGDYSFNRDRLINFINYCKNNSMFTNILEDITLKTNGVSFYSENFEEAITRLKFSGVLYTISPEQDGTIYINKNFSITDLLKNKTNYIDDVTNFINEYKKFEKENNTSRILK